VPRAPRDPFENSASAQAMRNWDRERGFVTPSSQFPVADLYLCWNSKALYLGLYAHDIIEEAYYRGKSVPKSERAVWTVQVAGGEAIRARVGSGREGIASDPEVRLDNDSGVNLNVRNVAILELPARKLGKARLSAGDTFELSSTFLSHGQAYRVEWQGTFKLRN